MSQHIRRGGTDTGSVVSDGTMKPTSYIKTELLEMLETLTDVIGRTNPKIYPLSRASPGRAMILLALCFVPVVLFLFLLAYMAIVDRMQR